VAVRHASRLKGGVDYPRSLPEFLEWFPDDAHCAKFLARLRWRDGFFCRACGHDDAWLTDPPRTRWVCSSCESQTTITAGTIFEGTRTPLTTWFHAAWLSMAEKNGMSALGLKRQLGVGSYETCWAMLHKFRLAMVDPGRDKLSGVVEVDETFVGGLRAGKRGRGAADKAIVAIAVERFTSPKRGIPALGRARMRVVPDAKGPTLIDFITDSVEPGSVIYTDGQGGYQQVAANGYKHEVIKFHNTKLKAHEELPGVHRVASLTKRWLLGTHHGGMQHKHLDYYLDEFVFRFNRRKSDARGLLFYRLLEGAVATRPITRDLIVRSRV
jgi:transposase-like protein